MVERQARDMEVRGSNPGPGSSFSLEFKNNYSIFNSGRVRIGVEKNLQ